MTPVKKERSTQPIKQGGKQALMQLLAPQKAAPPEPDLSKFDLLKTPVLDAKPSDPKKWCTRFNVPIYKANPEYYVNGKIVVPTDRPSFFLQKNTVVRLLDHRPGWSGIAFDRTVYRNVDLFNKAWVTIRVAGWVEDLYLDDYQDEFPNFDGVILNEKHQTRDSSDAEQVMIVPVQKTNKDNETIEIYDEFSGRKFNLCGEFSLAYAAHWSIDDVIEKWRTASPKVFDNMIGAGRDKPLGQFEIDDILTKVFGDQVKWKHYVPDLDPKDLTKQLDPTAVKVPLSDPTDPRRASAALQDWLKDYYLITNVRINTHTGELVPKGDEDRNHWIVLDQVTHNGKRVELYNPFPNSRQAYSFGEFYGSVGSNPNRGWWLRKQQKPVATLQNVPALQERDEVIVAIDNPTQTTVDAEQYAFIEGEPTKKNMLCGEFSVSYILTQSLERNLRNWLNAHPKPELPQLVRMAYAYGFNHRKYVVEDPKTGVRSIRLDLDSSGEYFKSFSIDTVLKYWRAVQPKLYESILHDRNDTGTGPEDLKTIFKAYGYKVKGKDHPEDYDVCDYINDTKNGETLRPPGKDREDLKNRYLIACVNIETERGSLISKYAGGKKTALHWIVVTNITPFGSQAGGNGGWVELYNPFTNRLEEYSYKEFTNSYSAPAVWVKREITPSFDHQKVKLFRDGDLSQASAQTSAKKVETKAWSADKLLNEIQKMRSNGKPDKLLPALLFGKNTGWSKEDLDALVAKQTATPSNKASMSDMRLGKMLQDCLHLKDPMPAEVVSLVSRASAEDRGDDNFALECVNTLREFGFLRFTKVQQPPDATTSGLKLKSPTEPKQALSFHDTPVLPAAPMKVSIAGPSAKQLQPMTEAARAQAQQSAALQLAAMERASFLTDKVASAIRPLFVPKVQEAIQHIRQKIAEEQKAKEQGQAGSSAPIQKVSPYKPSYRVMWDWEGWLLGAEKINRPELPCVFRCGEIDRPETAPFVDLTEEWQFFWFDLCCWVYYGRYHDDLTDAEYKQLANKWTSVGDSKRAFTNGKGLEKYRNFVLDERPRKRLPKIQNLVCGGASLAGTPVPYKDKGKTIWMLKVAHFDANRRPPDVRTIDPYTDPRVFFATTIDYDKKPGYTITFDDKTGPANHKPLTIKDNEAFAIGRFPEFDWRDPETHETKLIDCPVPIIADQDIYYPMRFLVPITDGKKANPYYPSKPYTGFGSPKS